MFIISFTIGLIIVISSIFLIRKEVNRAVRSQSLLLEQSRIYKDADLFDLLESLQQSVDEMNRAFYDIAGDLEGKYSVHEKEIQMINDKLDLMKNGFEPKVRTKELVQKMDQMNSEKREPEQRTALTHEEVGQVEGPIINDDQALIEKIIELRSKGKSLTQIAKELGIGMGEIQLLLALKK